MCGSDRKDAIDAVDLLNNFVSDFITGTMALEQYHKKYNSGVITEGQLVDIRRMCLSHLVLGLTKWAEFYKKFNHLIPSDLKDDAKQILKTIERRKVIAFRNKCVGHIWDKETNRPLTNSEIMAMLNTMTGNDIRGFLRWVNNPDPSEYPKSVAGISEAIRNNIAAAHCIEPSEVLNR